MTDARNIVASTPPLYIHQGGKYEDKDGTIVTIDFADSDTSGEGYTQDWNINLTIAGGTAGAVTLTAFQRKRFDLTGLYKQEKMIFPLGNNIQASESPLVGADKATDCFLREFEFWTTVELTDREIESQLLNAYMPTMPGFMGRQPDGGGGALPTPQAYLDSSNVIAGRARLYVGSSLFGTGYGWMTKIHESIIGEGEPAAAPDLHYVRAYYISTKTPAPGVSNWVFCDLPATRDVLTVGVTGVKDDVQWLNQIDRGAYNDAR